MKTLNLFALLLVAFVALLSSCNQPGSSEALTETADVYAAGYYTNSDGYEVACYWKNGTQHDIGVTGEPNDELEACDIHVDGSDVYVAGYLHDIGVDEWSARYWKNAEAAVVLTTTSGVNISMSLGIQVYNNDVYVAGIDGGQVCYWRNGTITDLSKTNYNSSRAEAIYVRDTGSVYTTGKYLSDTGARVACFWIYDYISEYALGSMINDARGTDIQVNSSGDIFVSGYVNSTGDDHAFYWENHTRTDLHTSSDSRAESIFLLNGDVYVGGRQHNGSNDGACYWKNGARTDLHTTSRSGVNGIAAVP